MSKAFKIRRFSRAELHKTFIRTQIQMKADGHLSSNRMPFDKSRSNDNLPDSDNVNKITATSTTLTYKTVRNYQSFWK